MIKLWIDEKKKRPIFIVTIVMEKESIKRIGHLPPKFENLPTSPLRI